MSHVSVVTEKDDLLFQFTYHAFFLAVDFQTKNTERHALTLHVKSTTGSGIKTTYYNVVLTMFLSEKNVSNILISVLPTSLVTKKDSSFQR